MHQRTCLCRRPFFSCECRALREELVAEGVQAPKKLVAVRPNDTLASVVRTLFECGCSMAPVLAQVDSGKQGA